MPLSNNVRTLIEKRLNTLCFSIVTYNPFLLFSPRSLRSRDRTLDFMNGPIMISSELRNAIMWEHRKYERPFNVTEKLQKSHKIIFIKDPLIMSAITIYIWRVDKMKSRWRIISFYNIESISTFNSYGL